VLSFRRPDGGYAGRAGPGDIYYTRFALGVVDLAGGADDWAEATRGSVAETCLPQPDLTDIFCLLDVRRMARVHGDGEAADARRVRALLRGCRAAEGGYAKRPGGPASVYHTFLAALCGQMAGFAAVQAGEATSLLAARRRPDGGFSDGPDMAVGAVNATAAAVALTVVVEGLDPRLSAGAADYLVASQRPDGGFAAHAQAPAADLMSTFTALTALVRLRAVPRADARGAGRFVKAQALRKGGFRGGPLDEGADVEYTYYGLCAAGVLGALARAHKAAGDVSLDI
jgi:prenyltransferase beta subunit